MTAPEMQEAPALAVTFAGQVIVGGWVSLTVIVKLQFATASEHVTVVKPFGKKDPEAGEHTIVPQVPPVVGAG